MIDNNLKKMVHIVPFCQEELKELYRDEYLLVVNKPPGLLSVPGRHPANHDSAFSRLKKNDPEVRVVHRLDLSTSGVMVFALNSQVHRLLNKLFQERLVTKGYVAEVYGHIKKSGSVDKPLRCDWLNRPKQIVDYDQGKAALTYYKLLESQKNSSFVWLKPITGRTHQLRVHMASIGYPIMGCEFYSPKEVYQARSRLQLHATSLTFIHPISSEELTFVEQPVFYGGCVPFDSLI